MNGLRGSLAASWLFAAPGWGLAGGEAEDSPLQAVRDLNLIGHCGSGAETSATGKGRAVFVLSPWLMPSSSATYLPVPVLQDTRQGRVLLKFFV